MRAAALIIGIDGWEKYTRPLIESIQMHEPDCSIVVIDNASQEPYPEWIAVGVPIIHRTERLCYSAAINKAAQLAGPANWYIVLSNDVLCTGPFFHVLAESEGKVVGPLLKENQGWQYLEGWCVCTPEAIWKALEGWDENFQVSSWEDVDFSVTVMEKGYTVVERMDLPFVHLDQRQRFTLVNNYWDSEVANVRYFRQKHRVAG